MGAFGGLWNRWSFKNLSHSLSALLERNSTPQHPLSLKFFGSLIRKVRPEHQRRIRATTLIGLGLLLALSAKSSTEKSEAERSDIRLKFSNVLIENLLKKFGYQEDQPPPWIGKGLLYPEQATTHIEPHTGWIFIRNRWWRPEHLKRMTRIPGHDSKEKRPDQWLKFPETQSGDQQWIQWIITKKPEKPRPSTVPVDPRRIRY